MHVRQQGSVLVLIRTTYDPIRKRGVQTTLARIPADTRPDGVPAEVLSQLTSDEVGQLRDYLAARADSMRHAHHKANLQTVHITLRDAVAALNAGLQPTDPAAVWATLGELQKALKKSGHPKPRTAGDVEKGAV